MKHFPMKRRVKTWYSRLRPCQRADRYYDSDRRHLAIKWSKRYMRLFIKEEAKEEINEAIESSD